MPKKDLGIERDEFMKEAGVDMVWRMAEGNPKTETDVTSGGQPIQIDKETKDKVDFLLKQLLNGITESRNPESTSTEQ